MCLETEQYAAVCKNEFAEIKDKIDRLDEAIRGNGRPGLMVRIDRLEQSESKRMKLLWLIAASVFTGSVSLTVTLIIEILKG